MKETELNRILDMISRIEHEGKRPPKNVFEIPELKKHYLSFKDIIEKLNNNIIVFSIPNFKLFGIHDFVVPNSEKRISKIFILSPYIIAILISIYGILTQKYWLITTLAIAYITPLLASILTGLFQYLILASICGYFFYNDNLTLGFIFMIALISIICTSLLKKHRRKSLINIAKSNEEIFTFLFHNRTIAILDERIDGMLYSK